MPKKLKTYLIHIGLFVATLITTTMAGVELSVPPSVYKEGELMVYLHGMKYSVPFLLILTVHEFGHYFTAKLKYKLKVTLPYYIPIPFIGIIGTMGAVIRIKDRIKSTKGFFDVGIAGPLAGFVVAMLVLVYGLKTLPPVDYVYQFHPDYEQFGVDYEQHVYDPEYRYTTDSTAFAHWKAYLLDSLKTTGDTIAYKTLERRSFEPYPMLEMGGSLMMELMAYLFVDDKTRMPGYREIYHYPFVFAGYLALFFTALNLLPIGQLDGGHILYGLVGSKYHSIVSAVIYVAFVFYSGLGVIELFDNDLLIIQHVLYLGFLFWIFTSLSPKKITALFVATLVFSAQFFLVLFFDIEGYSGWLLFALVLSRMMGIYHPKAEIEENLDTKRIVLGWLSLLIFVLCFVPQPVSFS